LTTKIQTTINPDKAAKGGADGPPYQLSRRNMARPTATTSAPTFTGTIRDLMEAQPRYPMELYKDGLYRVVHSIELHFQSLRKGWSEEAQEDMQYIPESATPEAIEAARKQSLAIAAKKQKTVETQTMITIDEARALVKEAVAEALGA
jgi:hypothetical protein